MSNQNTAEVAGMGRRGFFRRSATVVGAFVAGVVGVNAHATGGFEDKDRCCTLCKAPSNCDWAACKAVLCWQCQIAVSGGGTTFFQIEYLCMECFDVEKNPGDPCMTCKNVTCSNYQMISGYIPSPC